MKRYASAIGLLLLLFVACESGPEVEEGVFFPTWSADGDRPLAVVQGVLVEANGCVYISANGQRTLPAWEEGLGFANGTLLGRDGEPVAEVGAVVHGGGGWYGGANGRAHVEDLAGERIPDRCIIDEGPDRFAVIYEVAAGRWRSPRFVGLFHTPGVFGASNEDSVLR
jgi:hypothetical protein